MMPRKVATAEVEIPDLVVPFPLHINPHIVEARQRDLAWARRVGLISTAADERRYCSWDLAGLVAGWLPFASTEGMDLATNAFNWCTVYDDLHAGERATDADYTRSLGQPLLDYLVGAPLPERPNPLLCSLDDIIVREKKCAPPENHPRITESWRIFVSAFFSETDNRKAGKPLNFIEYRDVRRQSGAVQLMTDLIELANLFHTTPRARLLSPMQSLLNSANDAICFINDFYSFAKEEQADDQHNLIFALESEYGCLRRESIEYATNIILAECDNILVQQSILRKSCRELGLSPRETANAHRFAHEIGYPIASMVSWQQISGRYTDPDNSLYTSGLQWAS